MGSRDTCGPQADGRVVVRRGRLSEVLALIETAGAGGLVVAPAGSAPVSASAPSAGSPAAPAPGSPAAAEGGDPDLPVGGIYWLALRGGVPVGYAAGRLDARGCTPLRHAALPGPGHEATLDALPPAVAQGAEFAAIPLVEAT